MGVFVVFGVAVLFGERRGRTANTYDLSTVDNVEYKLAIGNCFNWYRRGIEPVKEL